MYDQGYSALIEDLRPARHVGRHAGLHCWPNSDGRRRSIRRAVAITGRNVSPSASPAAACKVAESSGRAIRSGACPDDRPTRRRDLATILHSLGLDVTSHLPGPAGRPFPLVDAGYGPIHELF